MSNNIKFGNTSYYTSYIQSFLRDNYSTNVLPTNTYDKQTHEALINYLNQPNVLNMNEVEKELKNKYSQLTTMFTLQIQNDELVYSCKVIDKNTSEFITINLSDLKEFALSMGWELSDYNNYVDYTFDINEDNKVDIVDRTLLQRYITSGIGLTEEQLEKADFNFDGQVNQTDYNLLANYIENNKLYLRFKAQDRKNFFPNKDMLNFVNLFSNDFYFYKAILDGGRNDGIVHDSDGRYKVCIIKCKPGQTYTIAHSSADTQRLVIGSLVDNKRSLNTSAIQNILDINVAPGQAILYTTSKKTNGNIQSRDAQYLLIQCSSNIEDYSGLQEKSEYLTLGNVNLDYYKDANGNDIKSKPKIDDVDRKLLADYIFYDELDERRPKFTEKQKVVADINMDGKIDGNDLQILADYLDGKILKLDTIEYKYYVPKNINELNNVASLLVMEGDRISEPTGETKSTIISIEHPQIINTLNTVTETYQNKDLGNCEIEITNPSTDPYDQIKFVANFVRIDGNSYREPNARLDTPKPIKVVTDINTLINGVENIEENLQDNKLVKINNVVDYIYQSQGKYYVHKEISEEYSSSLSWERIESTTSGKFYIRTKYPTSFKRATSDLQIVPNILSNKLETVSPYEILSGTFTKDHSISVDTNGRILVRVKEWDNLQLADILYWLKKNEFYAYGERQTSEDQQLSDEIKDLTLVDGNNTLEITSKNIAPSKVQIQAKALGITNAWLEEIKSTFQVTKSTIGMNFDSFTTDPWIVHSKFMAYLLDQAITPYSRSEDITYAQHLITELYPLYAESFIPGIYSDLLKDLIEQYQRSKISYGKGDLTKDNKITITDINLVREFIRGERKLSDEQEKLADVDGDTRVTVNDLNIMMKELDGINDDLKVFDIPFLMGYIDPSTEYQMLKDLSYKKYEGLSHREVGW